MYILSFCYANIIYGDISASDEVFFFKTFEEAKHHLMTIIANIQNVDVESINYNSGILRMHYYSNGAKEECVLNGYIRKVDMENMTCEFIDDIKKGE